MRILFLTFYYEPDLSAGSFRSTALVKALCDRMEMGDHIEVLTTEPNRYELFRSANSSKDWRQHVTVVRFALPKHRSGFVDQSYAFMAYAWQVLKYARGRQYDLVYATSSRLMTAFLGSVVSKWKGVPLYVDIRDIFVDTMKDVLCVPMRSVFMPIFRAIEKSTMRRAARINLVSEGFKEYFDRHYPNKRYRYVPNGVDEEFFAFNFRNNDRTASKLTVLYAGNMGEGQGLHRIVPALAEKLTATHEFWIVGDGGARTKLETATKRLSNVKIMPPVDRATLLSLYRQSDILFLHLNEHPAFQKVLPSKLFEYAVTGKPILAGVGGHAAEFLGRVPNVAIFTPCNAQAAALALVSLWIGYVSRNEFAQRYRRTRLMGVLADDILSTVKSSAAEVVT